MCVDIYVCSCMHPCVFVCLHVCVYISTQAFPLSLTKPRNKHGSCNEHTGTQALLLLLFLKIIIKYNKPGFHSVVGDPGVRAGLGENLL